MEELASKLKVKHFYDVIVEREKDIEQSIRVVASINSNLFLLDSGSPTILERGVQIASQFGVIERLMINSINYSLTDTLLKTINRHGVRNAVLQIFNPREHSFQGRIKILENLLKKLGDSTIENKIVDCAVSDLNSIPDVVQAFTYIKKQWNLLVGGAPCNLTYILRKKEPDFLSKNFQSYDTALNILFRSYGADFLIYGHIKSHSRIFKAIHTYDTVKRKLSVDRSNSS